MMPDIAPAVARPVRPARKRASRGNIAHLGPAPQRMPQTMERKVRAPGRTAEMHEIVAAAHGRASDASAAGPGARGLRFPDAGTTTKG